MYNDKESLNPKDLGDHVPLDAGTWCAKWFPVAAV